MDFTLLITVVLPILAIEIALIVVALRDLLRPDRHVRGGSKGVWIIVIVFLQLLGPILYFTLGREAE